MSMDFSVSLNGIFAAEQNLNQSAHRIATATLPSSGDANEDTFSLSDIAAEFIAMSEAKTAIKANLKFVSVQKELQRDTLDLFA
jgi:hypothetical protein